MQKYIYLLKLKQEQNGAKSESDYAFQSSANLWLYLQDLWAYWQQNYSQEDLERLPLLPTIGEIKAGLAANTSRQTGYQTHELVGIGYTSEHETFSMVLTVIRMPVY
jgi:hypothetical protein